MEAASCLMSTIVESFCYLRSLFIHLDVRLSSQNPPELSGRQDESRVVSAPGTTRGGPSWEICGEGAEEEEEEEELGAEEGKGSIEKHPNKGRCWGPLRRSRGSDNAPLLRGTRSSLFWRRSGLLLRAAWSSRTRVSRGGKKNRVK